MRMSVIGRCAGILAASHMFCCTAIGGFQLDIDLNRLTAQAQGVNGNNLAFSGTNFTGKLVLGSSSNSVLAGIAIDGTSQPVSGTLSPFEGLLTFTSGQITGGTLKIRALQNNLPQVYELQVLSDSSLAIEGGSSNYDMLGAIGSTQLQGDTLAGVDISLWRSLLTSNGFFAVSGYSPNAAGFDSSVNLDLTVFAPEPSAAFSVLLGCALVGRSRRHC